MTTNATEQRNILIAVLACVAAGVVLFGYMFGFDFMMAGAAFWKNPVNDMSAMTAGFEAFIRDPWTFPITITHRLGESTPITYTDSIPWLSVLLKALHLGGVFNPLGLFLLISYVLQPIAIGAVLRSLGARNPTTYLIAGLLALAFPAWIARQFGHIALCGHFVLIFGLALSISSARMGLTTRRAVLFGALAVLATGIHAYHLLPVGLLFGAALTAELVQKGKSALLRVLLSGAAVLLSVILSAWVLGYMEGAGDSGGVGSIGFYSMNILGPVYPQASALAGQVWNGGWFTGVMDPNGGQQFEGFQYLGGGILAAIALGLGLTLWGWRDPATRPDKAQLARFAPLVAACIILSVWAVGPKGYLITHLLFDVPVGDGAFVQLLSYFRCHGRLFWVVGYLLLAASMVGIERGAPRRALPVLGLGLLALQAFDTSPLRQGVRTIYAQPGAYYYPKDMMSAAVVQGRPWIFEPEYFCANDTMDRLAIAQLTLAAVRAGGTSNTVATARNTGEDCSIPSDLLKTAAPNDPRILVVLDKGRTSGGRFAAVAARTDCHRFVRGFICGAGLTGLPGLAPVSRAEMVGPRIASETLVPFNVAAKSPLLASGWSMPEPQGVWSDGASGVIEIPAAMLPTGPLALEVTALAFGLPPKGDQKVPVFINDVPLGVRQIEVSGWRPYLIYVPEQARRSAGPLRLRFDFPEAGSPPGDPRKLAMAVQSLRILALAE
ncbi:DUF6311 domain-containing protein [Caulobacter sp. NIBR2454]|uniref:DUF6311 domain-containing protein n=1 Tax=Caulobacter sp. NIBR2454 TaxID=3015996 RepID=UPI0022B6B95D|nr:DUF6311 domain-containing protein [Caulobacter sp. NIBR2454]